MAKNFQCQKILYECSLNVEPPRRFVHLRCTSGFRWKLPAEPDRLLPITCACSDAVDEIAKYLALATRASDVEVKKFNLTLAADEAERASKIAELPKAETNNIFYNEKAGNVQCILFPRWIDRSWPFPSYGQTLAESFRALAYQILKCNSRTWPKEAPRVLEHLDGFWEQLTRAEKAALTSADSWTVYKNPIFDDDDDDSTNPPVRPNHATSLYNRIVLHGPSITDDLKATLFCASPEEQRQLDLLLDQCLRHAL